MLERWLNIEFLGQTRVITDKDVNFDNDDNSIAL